MPVPEQSPTYQDLVRDIDAFTASIIEQHRILPEIYAHDDLIVAAHRLYWKEKDADAARVGVTYDPKTGMIGHPV